MIKVIEYDINTGEIFRVITYWDAEEAKTLYPKALLLPLETPVNDIIHIVKNGKVVLKSEYGND